MDEQDALQSFEAVWARVTGTEPIKAASPPRETDRTRKAEDTLAPLIREAAENADFYQAMACRLGHGRCGGFFTALHRDAAALLRRLRALRFLRMGTESAPLAAQQLPQAVLPALRSAFLRESGLSARLKSAAEAEEAQAAAVLLEQAARAAGNAEKAACLLESCMR